MKRMIPLVAAALALSACSTHKVHEPTLTGLALQSLQSRDFEAQMPVVFASTLSVLQDTGYIVESADRETGFITAKSPSGSNVSYDLFWGLGKRHKTTRVTAFVEPLGGDMSKVRLNFVAINENSNMYGTSREDTPLEDAKIYQNVFEKIEETIFIRLATQ